MKAEGKMETNIFASYTKFRTAEKKFLEDFQVFSSICEHQTEISWRKSKAKKCLIKDEPFSWECDFEGCPFIYQGRYKLKGETS